jgi:hypothetical protein
MTVMTALISALAVWEIVEVWHHSSLFATRRAYLEVRGGWLADMLLCPFCLSVWVAFLVIFILKMDVHLAQHVPRWVIDCIQLPIYGFAVARLANLFNDLTRSKCRTPKDGPWPVGDDSGESEETESDENASPGP